MHIFHKWRTVKVWQEVGVVSYIWSKSDRKELITIAHGLECDVCGKRKVNRGIWFNKAPQRFLDEINRWEKKQ